MLFVYLPVSLLVAIVAVKFFSFYERDVCLFVLCWLEALADKQNFKRLNGDFNQRSNLFGIRKTRVR
jgi:hypothetical protein